MHSIPTHAGAVVIGGGVVGCSVAYHLARLGFKDVILLEQNDIAAGTTWHAAGLIGRLRTSNSLTKINKESAELYARLERETGQPVGWKQVGSLILARSESRMVQLRRTAAMSKWFDVEVQMIPANEARERWPLLRVDDILGAAWLPHDGKVLPRELAIALARGAEQMGARIFRGVRVREVLQRHGRVTGVEYLQRVADGPGEPGTVAAETVVLCGGMWSRELGLRCGVTIPLHPVEHHWVLTDPIEGVRDELPVGRDPDLGLYFRGEGGAVMLGAFQAESRAWLVDRVPEDFAFKLLDPDWEKFEEPLRHGRWRIPALGSCGFSKFTNGPESFTPDNQFLLGEAPELRRLFVAAGFNSVGIASAGGAGRYLAEWIIDGQPSIDLWSVDLRRFGPWANNRAFLRSRVIEVLGLHYQPAWPNREPATGRGLRRSALQARWEAAGACFGVRSGWERPLWFAGKQPGRAAVPVMEYSFGRQNWFLNHRDEHEACRQRAAIFDQSGFGKLSVQGRDAVRVLDRVCARSPDVPVGRVIHTGMFNERGGFESDLIVVRTGRESFYVVTGAAQPVRDADWIRRHVGDGEVATVTEVTSSYGVLGVMGPLARRWLGRVTDADLSHEAFPFGTAREIGVGLATALALRMTYVGELGWELHVPMEQLEPAFDALMEHAGELGAVPAGHYAINSLRLEKGYRAWGAELSPDDTPIEAGLGAGIDWHRNGFVGAPILGSLRGTPPRRRLGIFVLQDPEPVLWGAELIYRNGEIVGYTTSGSYAHTLGGGIGMGYVGGAGGVSEAFLEAGTYEIGVNGERIPARLHLRAPYDPKGSRIFC